MTVGVTARAAEGAMETTTPEGQAKISHELARAVAAQRRAQSICGRALTVSAMVEAGRVARRSNRDNRAVARESRDHVRALENQVANLQIALERRGVIEQAKGILMARLGCGADDAFGVLVRVSQTHHRKLREVAAAIVEDRASALERKPSGRRH
jgi:AmiR/NasT family two-component response regulator